MKRLPSGYYEVRVQVSADVMRFAIREARSGGYSGPADYLNAVLNTAMLREMEDEPPLAEEIAARRKAARESEDGLSF